LEQGPNNDSNRFNFETPIGKVGASGAGIYLAALLIAVGGTVGAVVHTINGNAKQITNAVQQAAEKTTDELRTNRGVQQEFRNAIVDLGKKQEWTIYKMEVQRCIDVIEKLPQAERDFFWSRWSNKDQVRVKCPFLGNEPRQ
jgi:hypothetical protein